MHRPDDTIGLNFRLYNELANNIQRLFQPRITITKASIERAMYFHGYLLEQTLQIFDITSLATTVPILNPIIGKELIDILCRDILLIPKIIITKQNLYSLNGMKLIFKIFCKANIIIPFTYDHIHI